MRNSQDQQFLKDVNDIKEDSPYLIQGQQGRQRQTDSTAGSIQQYEQYMSLMFEGKQAVCISKGQLIKQLESYSIRYCEQLFYKSLSITIIQNTFNYEVIKCLVRYGYFSTTLTIINIDHTSPIAKLNLVNSGRFGSIYQYRQNNEQTIAIKSVQFNNSFIEGLKQSAKEYLILKIASILKIGPTFQNPFGFDLMVYRSSIQFAMEYCDIKMSTNNINYGQLKRKLYKLHLLNIIHSDIKPENIAFSSRQQQWILLDFGLSKMIKEKICLRTYTGFSGSYNFCSEQMRRLFLQSTMGYVNLYLNDTKALIQTLNTFEIQSQMQNQQQTFQAFSYESIHKMAVDTFVKFISNKFMLFCASFNVLRNLKALVLNSSYMINQYQKFIDFIRELPKNEYMENYLFTISPNKDMEFTINGLKNKNKDEETINQVFVQRYMSLKYGFFLGKQIDQGEYFQKSLQLLDKKKDQYFLFLAKLMNINGQLHDVNLEKACQIVYQRQANSAQKIKKPTFQEQYYLIMRKLIDFSLESPFSTIKYEILIKIIATCISLQITSQSDLKKIVKTIISLETTLFIRLHLVFHMISSLEYIKCKYKTSYDILYLQTNISSLLTDYISTIDTTLLQQKDSIIIDSILFMLNKDQLLCQSFDNILAKALKISTWSHGEQHFLFEQMTMHVLYYKNSIKLLARTQTQYDYDDVQDIYLHFENSKDKFTYHYFLLEKIYFFNKVGGKFQKVYDRFLKRFAKFKQHKYFIIRWDYLVNLIHEIVIFDCDEKSKTNIIKSQQNAQQQLLEIYLHCQQTSHNIYPYLNKFLLIFNKQTMKKAFTYFNVIKEIIKLAKNQQIKFNPHQSQNQWKIYHKNNLKLQTSIVFHFLLLYFNLKIQGSTEEETFFSFFTSVKNEIQGLECFDCKVECLMKVEILSIRYSLHKRDFSNIIGRLVELQIFCIRNHPALYKFESNLIEMLFYAYKQQQFGNIVLDEVQKRLQFSVLMQLIFHWVKQHGEYLVLLKINDLCQHFLFVMYNYILTHYDIIEFIVFIRNLCICLYKNPSSVNSHEFYKRIIGIIKHIEIYQPDCQSWFIEKHQIAVNRIISFNQFIPFYALYFAALLEIKKPGLDYQKLMRSISIQVNFLPFEAKREILKNYYKFYSLYFFNSYKKMKYLQKMDAKFNKINNFNKYFYKLSNIRKLKDNNRKYQYLLNAIEKHHRIFNLFK